MAATRYYAWRLYDVQGTESETISVHRVIDDGAGRRMERYDPAQGEWVPNHNGLLTLTGAGGDHNYEEVTRDEVVDFLAGENLSPKAIVAI